MVEYDPFVYDPFVVIKCWNCDTDRWQGIGPCGTCGAPARIDLTPEASAGSATPTGDDDG